MWISRILRLRASEVVVLSSVASIKRHQRLVNLKSSRLLSSSSLATSGTKMAAAQMQLKDPDPRFVEVCRMMSPDDANFHGNVHGGVILKMIEQAGVIISTRHCNSQRESEGEEAHVPCYTALVRVERTDFLQPMFIGEVAQLHAEITHTAHHSLEVQVKVWAENIMKGTKRLTNRATLWYLPMAVDPPHKIQTVPKMTYINKETEEAGWSRYRAQKADRERKGLGGAPSLDLSMLERMRESQENGLMEHTVAYAQSSLIHLAGVSDCNAVNYVYGGVTMKFMDEVAGITAAKYCKTNVVTASMDTVNFHKPIKRGSVMYFTGRPTFTSAHSMEIEVFVDTEALREGITKKERAVHAFFTFVSLSQPERKVLPIPCLQVQTDGEASRFFEGKMRYCNAKRKRIFSEGSSVD
ncbi:putative cytosolic acyl coenzyme A thioester hydrolase-like [Amphiura filiformis]|uniref:putative cytosolic acyl coenzyme A thioester hydrolase-like n=1 Tax=Amphiura filiformis TaxID=82378 RepID=UPI003B21562C